MQSGHKRSIRAASVICILLAAGAATLVWLNRDPLPKRFGVVVPGALYRCGEVSPAELERVASQYEIRTVLSLLNPDAPESIAERRAAGRLGLRWENVPLRGDGSSTPADRRRIEKILFDPDAGPLLVHCAAGANRTGLAVGIYRIRKQGWTPEQVLAEMREYGFEDLPKHENLRQALRAEWAARPPQTSPPSSSRPPQVPRAPDGVVKERLSVFCVRDRARTLRFQAGADSGGELPRPHDLCSNSASPRLRVFAVGVSRKRRTTQVFGNAG